jgi:hypothetical protein
MRPAAAIRQCCKRNDAAGPSRGATLAIYFSHFNCSGEGTEAEAAAFADIAKLP